MKRGIIQALKILAFLALGLLLLWLAFREIDFSSLKNGLMEARYVWLLLSILLGLLAYFSRARRWNLLIYPLGYKPKLSNTFHAMMTGYLANMALPRIGEISKCVALGKKENIPIDRLLGTVVIERAIDFLSLMVIMVIMIFIDGNTIGPFLIDNVWIPVQAKLSEMFGSVWIFWIIIAFSGTLVLYLIYAFRRKLRRIRFFSKLFDTVWGITHGLKTITALHNKWEFVFHTVFIWINYILMTWVIVFSIDSTSHLGLRDGVFLLVIGGLAMTAPVQSGLGAFHFIVSRGLYVIYGISLTDGLVYAILAHESQLIFGAILGFYSFYSIMRKPSLSASAESKAAN